MPKGNRLQQSKHAWFFNARVLWRGEGRRRFPFLFLLLGLSIATGGMVSATEFVLKDGRVLHGMAGKTSGMLVMPNSGGIESILFIDDDLRRTYISTKLLREPPNVEPEERVETFRIYQRISRRGKNIASVGHVLKTEPFDEYGRRILTLQVSRGNVDVVQGITRLTPNWARVDGISHTWSMRIATSSIPIAGLRKILIKQIDTSDLEDRKKIVRFHVQGKRYGEARRCLEKILVDFPDTQVKKEIEPILRGLNQLAARRFIRELKLQKQVGQHRLAWSMYENFPKEGIAGEIRQEVRELIQQYQTLKSQREEVLAQYNNLLKEISDTNVRMQLRDIGNEIASDLSFNTTGRMVAFRQMAGDKSMSVHERLSLAVSGWLLGGDAATVKLPVALSAYRVRKLVKQFLNEPDDLRRSNLFDTFRSQEAATPETVAAILSHMKPPVDMPAPTDVTRPGYYELEITLQIGEPPVRYCVQLPPEYDPYRRYPTIVTLRGAHNSAEQQLQWWAGPWTEKGTRKGQATRYGYIVIAPDWPSRLQKQYKYSAREHAAVLYSLRDASRRFSIDTDRVFLTGHSMGGDAAWDIGLAHPDLWAGVIPIVATAGRYVTRYWPNAKGLPLYFVVGEKDGNKMTSNATDFNRYLTRVGFNATIVQYLGRGHESFYEEILHLFDWMGRFERNFFPKEFTCSTMRPNDNFFWWVEVSDLPTKSMVEPEYWPPKRGVNPLQISGRISETNSLLVRKSAGETTVWISPGMVDFKKKIQIIVRGKKLNGREPFLEPNLRVLLEDVRARADRQHPFWARYSTTD